MEVPKIYLLDPNDVADLLDLVTVVEYGFLNLPH